MTRIPRKFLLTVAGLLALLTYLWAQSRDPDLERRVRWHETLRTLELRDTELMRDVLLARAGLLPHYDTLTRTGHELQRLARQLREDLERHPGEATAVLVQPADALIEALQRKLENVEHFKSDNALLRNSIMYFDLSGHNLRGRTSAKAAAEIAPLWQGMLSFVEQPGQDLGQQLGATLDRLAGNQTLPEETHALVRHGRLVVAMLPQLDSLMREIIAAPIPARIGALQDGLSQFSMAAEQRAEVFRLLLYLVAVVLLCYLLYQFARLRAGNLALRRAHTALKRETIERRQAEDSLRASEERLRAMTESAHEAIVSVDQIGNIVSWNRGAEAMFGYGRAEALGTPLARLLAERNRLTPSELFAEGGAEAAAEISGLRRDGGEFPLEVSLSRWSRGGERFATAIMRDISARKRLEETTRQQELKLIQTSKMTALGTMVSCVAHEINNPNQLILMNSGLLADAWTDALDLLDAHEDEAGDFSLGGLPYSEMRESLPVLIHDIHDGAKRIERIVADLKDFARPHPAGLAQAFPLNDSVRRAVRLLGHLIGRKTSRFTTDLEESLPAVRGDAQQVEQVVVNLIVNALEALPDRDHGVHVCSFRRPGEGLVGLEVTDEGTGIAPEHLDQLCDPFFTTKQASGGTGLGLAISASLVRAHGGRLEFDSSPGRGTSVRVVLPEN